MILRAMGAGFLLWLAVTAAFRFGGALFFHPDGRSQLVAFVVAPALALGLGFLLVRALRASRGDEAEAAIGLALPGALLHAYSVKEFQTVFPNLDPLLGQDFGALMLLWSAMIVTVGVLMTRISAQDERV